MEPATQAFAKLIAPFVYPLLGQQRIFILYLLTALAIAVVVCARAGAGNPGAILRQIFPRSVYAHPSARVDYRYFVVNAVVWGLFLGPFLLGAGTVATSVRAALVALSGGEGLGFAPGAGATVVLTVFAILAFDLGIFVAHWSQHRIPALWAFHQVHHSAEVLTPITVYRMHPVDDLLSGLLSGALTGIVHGIFAFAFLSEVSEAKVFGINLALFAFYLAGYNLRHSHVWLAYPPAVSRWLMSPAQHQVHHSTDRRHFDSNLGFIFAFWDRLAGTLYVPLRKEAIVYGLGGGRERRFDGVRNLYLQPFRELAEIWRARQAKAGGLSWIKLGAAVLVGLVVSVGAMSRSLTAPASGNVFMEELTWVEVRGLIQQGKTVAIVPTGGTEQNGPHMVLGKHNFIVRHTAGEIARQLGNALVAPVIAYVPEGDIDPPTEHMGFAGTLTVPEPVFAAVLESTARSLKAHGFRTIAFVGDSGGNQKAQDEVAAKLNAEWTGQRVRVVHVGDYYAANGQFDHLLKQGETRAGIGYHAGIRDTSELWAVFPQGVRPDQMKQNGLVWERTGVSGDPTRASAERGAELLKLKIDAAVKQIRAALARVQA